VLLTLFVIRDIKISADSDQCFLKQGQKKRFGNQDPSFYPEDTLPSSKSVLSPSFYFFLFFL